MLSHSSLKLFGIYFGLAHKVGFTPFPWNYEQHCFQIESPRSTLGIWRFWLFLIQAKFVYLLIQLVNLCKNDGDMGHIIFHIYFLMPTCLAAIVQFDFLFKLKDFPGFFRRVRRFSDAAKEIYMSEFRDAPVLKFDGVEPLVYFGFAIGLASPIGIFGLNMSSQAEKMPQLFYSMFVAVTGKSYIWLRFPFSVLEGCIIALSWVSCMFHAILLPALSMCFTFWTQRLANGLDTISDQNVCESKKIHQMQKTYRELQILATQLDQSLSKIIATIFTTAFVNQVSANYATIVLYNSMDLVAWLPCPVLVVGGTNTLMEMQKFFGNVFVVSQDLLYNRWDKVKLEPKEQEIFARFRKSCQYLKITQGGVYYFKKESAHLYIYAILQYTLTFLLW